MKRCLLFSLLLLGSCRLLLRALEVDACNQGANARCEGNSLVRCVDGFEIFFSCEEASCNPAGEGSCDLCGDGELTGPESCDDGQDNSDTTPNACRTDCQPARCGDSVVDTAEDCDDGNNLNTDDCVTACQLASCGDGFVLDIDGDGVVDPADEACDDSNNVSGDGCQGDCARSEVCGDGIKDPQEDCDDGNQIAGDGCRIDCTIEACGDGIVDPGELCYAAPLILLTRDIPSAVTLADIEGDGDLDFVVSHDSDIFLNIFRNNGAGVFNAPEPAQVGAGSPCVGAADLDGDGRPELVAALFGFTNSAVALSNNGAGLFTAGPFLDAGTDPNAVRFGDMDEDGDLDAILGNNASQVLHVLFNDNGALSPVEVPVGADSPLTLEVGDLNGDNHLDILTSNLVSNSFSVLLNDGAGQFAAPLTTTFLGSGTPRGVALFDFDDDFDLDFGAIIQSGDLVTGENDGDGNFTMLIIPSASGGFGNGNDDIEAADIDSDGDLDLVLASTNDSAAILLRNNGALGIFDPQNRAVVPLGLSPRGVAVGDVNGDTLLDLIAAGDVPGPSHVSIILSTP